jgi:hypothetical protein
MVTNFIIQVINFKIINIKNFLYSLFGEDILELLYLHKTPHFIHSKLYFIQFKSNFLAKSINFIPLSIKNSKSVLIPMY